MWLLVLYSSFWSASIEDILLSVSNATCFLWVGLSSPSTSQSHELLNERSYWTGTCKQTRWIISDDESVIPLLCVLDHAFVDDILMPVAIPTCFAQIGYLLWEQVDCLNSGMKGLVELEYHFTVNYPLMQRRQIIVGDEIAIFWSLSFWSRLQSKHLSVSACHLSIRGRANRNIFAFLISILFGCSLIQVQCWGHAHQVKEPACGFYRRLYGQDTVGVSCLSPNEWSWRQILGERNTWKTHHKDDTLLSSLVSRV